MYRKNRLPIFSLLLGLVMFVQVACTGNPAGEPAANNLPTETPEPTEEPTESPDDASDDVVSSEDPTPAPEAEEEEEGDGEVTIQDAVITNLQIMIMESWPLQASAQVEGELGDGCTELVEPITAEREGDTFHIPIQTSRPVDAVCTMILQTFSETIPLDIEGLEAGTYTVNVNGVEETFTLEQDNVAQPEEEEEGESAEGELSEEDRAELIRLTLERALIDQEIPDFGLIEDPQNIVLSSENIDPSLVPELEGVNLTVLTPEEIQEKANEEGDFLHLHFDEITVQSADKVTVSLSNRWAVAEDSETGYLSGGGFTVEYTRDGDSWSGEVTTQWIS